MHGEHNRPPLSIPPVAPLVPPADFRARLDRLGVNVDDAAIARVGAYLAKLLAMNDLVNLTSITDPLEVWSRHALDALSLLSELTDVPAGARLLDVGSGGGVPGVPVAIARPDLRVTLLDATEKKAAFLRAVVVELGLTNVEVVRDRAEALAQTPRKRSFDVVTARAVAKLALLLTWTAPLAKRGGKLLFIKGERADLELREAQTLLRRHHCTHVRTGLTETGRVVVLRVG